MRPADVQAPYRRAAQQLRAALAWPFALPAAFRGPRGAWRRQRLEALLAQLETNPPQPTREDPAAFLRLVEELRELWRREKRTMCTWINGGLAEHMRREANATLERESR